MLAAELSQLKTKRILLASGSVNRKQILSMSGIDWFEVSPSEFAEDLDKKQFATSKDYVIKTSEMKLKHKVESIKASMEAKPSQPVDVVICADTIISLDDKIVLEKPENKDHAFQMLSQLRDAGSNQAYTSVWIAFLDPIT